MKRFLVFTNTIKDIETVLTNKIKEYIESKNGICNTIFDLEENGTVDEAMLLETDIAIVLGGDGTILRASNLLCNYNIPIVGVNLGTLGFLAEVEPVNIYQVIDRLFNDDYIIENRMHIEGQVYRDGQPIYEGNSLNDIVITRAGYSRIVGLKIWVNNVLLNTYEADGVIVSTPTGSTGYNLSAGGPIVSPNTSLIIVTPVSPHSLTSKSIVFSSEDEISIEIVEKRKTETQEEYITFDGRQGIPLYSKDIINIRKSIKTTKLIKMYNVNFFEVLKNKMN